MWSSHKHLILISTCETPLTVGVKTEESDKKRSYVEEHLSRRIDTFERSYLSLKHERKSRKH